MSWLVSACFANPSLSLAWWVKNPTSFVVGKGTDFCQSLLEAIHIRSFLFKSGSKFVWVWLIQLQISACRIKIYMFPTLIGTACKNPLGSYRTYPTIKNNIKHCIDWRLCNSFGSSEAKKTFIYQHLASCFSCFIFNSFLFFLAWHQSRHTEQQCRLPSVFSWIFYYTK